MADYEKTMQDCGDLMDREQKTADQMLYKLGYIKKPLKDAQSGCAVAFYRKENGDHDYEIEVVSGVPGKEVAIEFRMDGRMGPALGEEAKAVAQLIREMEAANV